MEVTKVHKKVSFEKKPWLKLNIFLEKWKKEKPQMTTSWKNFISYLFVHVLEEKHWKNSKNRIFFKAVRPEDTETLYEEPKIAVFNS